MIYLFLIRSFVTFDILVVKACTDSFDIKVHEPYTNTQLSCTLLWSIVGTAMYMTSVQQQQCSLILDTMANRCVAASYFNMLSNHTSLFKFSSNKAQWEIRIARQDDFGRSGPWQRPDVMPTIFHGMPSSNESTISTGPISYKRNVARWQPICINIAEALVKRKAKAIPSLRKCYTHGLIRLVMLILTNLKFIVH